MTARISEIFLYTKNPESDFFLKNPNLTTTKKIWQLGGEEVGMWLE